MAGRSGGKVLDLVAQRKRVEALERAGEFHVSDRERRKMYEVGYRMILGGVDGVEVALAVMGE